MITMKAYAKINWSLAVTGTRPNGYHDLDMLMQRISLHDTLTFEPADTLELSIDHQLIPSDADNLVLKAARALIERCDVRRGARITLEKRIPARAGLAGGSADCACTLIALNQLWNLGLSREQLEAIGLTLGADVPFCVRECFCRAQGLGEILTPLPSAPQIYLALVTPPPGLSTPEVFRKWNEGYPSKKIDTPALARALQLGDFAAAQSLSFNDLEAPAIDILPAIGECVEKFRALGSPFVRMSGSGSTVFAVFESEMSAVSAARQVPGASVVRTLGFVNQL